MSISAWLLTVTKQYLNEITNILFFTFVYTPIAVMQHQKDEFK